ncbi:MAG: ribosome assembly RNA-binding protein YhbY [Candidatus Thiodiazotropha sp. (ex Ctena orbiculata)]|uniref:Ribosome assembly RNA-binding protein YhbY n=1 Tax=Candidatus Thiodiazotropha taylori TaxID=2792791 RepID=A0A944M880_9GAMM|nr:ribosome assembly RNA-binding protein YhbY [Candidatus Thiodiazotropha taylori]MBT2988582.1 ribosome assembly RNA-binding protein YhbY [Candidatus Thiodiazotropha taylori]MBT2997449.1 ribosome assembly RNA-binding protein YhbY [Candidatus Thiodiazotropha taylori]MBT3001123.1 ribosome assembly RNA-binding protein YhbY [Candidatus Thiodiazotropha taylori]MBT3027614.1 ribosome assembly RNA-binding protein YhbY [Candidatus Thiodiazotropha taylori]
MPLTNAQIRALKKIAHTLKPVVIVGQHGLSENVLNEIDSSLDSHELIKVKLAGADKEDRKELSNEIIQQLSAELVQIIGRVAIFYRPNPKKKKNRVII